MPKEKTKQEIIDNKLEDRLSDSNFNEIQIPDNTEMGAIMTNLDRDEVDSKTKMSSIDVNTRLEANEINSCLILDELVRLGILPDSIGLTRQKKRLAISLRGQGRQEKVNIVSGQREFESGSTFGSRFANLFKKQG